MRRVLARTIYMVIVLVLSSIAVFYAIRLSGGDAVAARVPASASAEEREAVREQLGLNDPFHQQYFDYVGSILSGDLGNSLTNNARISTLIAEHGKNSSHIWVSRPSCWFSASAYPLGLLASLRRNSWWDGGNNDVLRGRDGGAELLAGPAGRVVVRFDSGLAPVRRLLRSQATRASGGGPGDGGNGPDGAG